MSQPGSLFLTPDKAAVAHSHVERFRKYLNKKFNSNLVDVWDLHQFSVSRSNDFWTAIWHFTGVIGDLDPTLPLFDESRRLPDTKHTLNARLSWAENPLLGSSHARSDKRVAVHCTIEKSSEVPDGVIRSLTYEGLYQEVRKAMNALKEIGVKENDRVAAFCSNNVEAIVLVLATNALGAIWSSSPPEFGCVNHFGLNICN